MSQNEVKNTPLSRRGMLAGAGAVGVAAVAATVVARHVAPEVVPVAEKLAADPNERRGYQDTEHVRRYYQTARV